MAKSIAQRIIEATTPAAWARASDPAFWGEGFLDTPEQKALRAATEAACAKALAAATANATAKWRDLGLTPEETQLVNGHLLAHESR